MDRDARRHARERREREQPRHAQHERTRRRRRDHAEHGRSREQAVVPVRREVDDEPGAADRPRCEPADAQVAAVRRDQRREPERPDRAGDLRRTGAHATTTEHTAL